MYVSAKFINKQTGVGAEMYADLEADWSSVDGRRERTYHLQCQQHRSLVANRQVDPRLNNCRKFCIVFEPTLLALLQINKLHHGTVQDTPVKSL